MPRLATQLALSKRFNHGPSSLAPISLVLGKLESSLQESPTPAVHLYSPSRGFHGAQSHMSLTLWMVTLAASICRGELVEPTAPKPMPTTFLYEVTGGHPHSLHLVVWWVFQFLWYHM